MVFNSYTFFLFLFGLLAIYRLPTSWTVKKFNLLWASYLFYAAWNPPFVTLLVLSTLLDWFASKWLYTEKRVWMRRVLLSASLMGNLGVLAWFKYGGFLAGNLEDVLGWFGHDGRLTLPEIILPAGISFYTFQTLSYTLDVYRGNMKPGTSFLDFALYVTFFPQLVAGPIVRATDFLPQCEKPKPLAPGQLGWGLSLILLGLFEKVVLADGFFAPVVEDAYAPGITAGTLGAWTGTIAFAGQIFCDFAGYSTCAIGTALCFGFHLNSNFAFPYAAAGFSDFWRRWHISLSTWLRDYLYIPLGGNRRGSLLTYRNLLATMLLGGLWHGAAWTFVVWGGLHGLFLSIERMLTPFIRRNQQLFRLWGKPAAMALTFAGVCYTWVFFRARSFDQAFMMVRAMTGFAPDQPDLELGTVKVVTIWLIMGALLATHAWMRNRTVETVARGAPRWILVLVVALMAAALALVPGEDRAFIYFQF